MGTRENILAALATRLATAADVTTVKRSLLDDFELRRYTRSQLPLVVIVEPDEEPNEYTGSRHALTTLSVQILLIYEQWNWDGTGPTQVNGLRDNVLNAFHSDITNSNTSHTSSVVGISAQKRTYPIFVDLIETEIEFYQSYTAR